MVVVGFPFFVKQTIRYSKFLLGSWLSRQQETFIREVSKKPSTITLITITNQWKRKIIVILI